MPFGLNKMKFAWLGHTVSGIARMALSSRSRSATTSATPRSISDKYFSAMVPATCLSASRWYGNVTISRSSIIHVGAIR